jgi:hypothetical protein
MIPEPDNDRMQVGSRRQIVVAGALAVVLLALVARSLLKADSADAASPASQLAAVEQQSEDDIAELIASFVQRPSPEENGRAPAPAVDRDPFVMQAAMRQWIADKTAPANDQTTATLNVDRSLTLKGIMTDSDGPVAFINNRIVRPGDRIEGYEILRIDQQDVLVGRDGAEATLSLAQPDLGNGEIQ